MAIGTRCRGLALATIFVIGIVFLGSGPQATAETLNFKFFNHVTKAERLPIADVEGHVISLMAREGVIIVQTGDLGWFKAAQMLDFIKGGGTVDWYATYTFLDGSTVTTHNKGRVEASPQGVESAGKSAGDIIHGTGRFQGIKGTVTMSTKILPPEKEESGGKALGEATLVYTLPGK